MSGDVPKIGGKRPPRLYLREWMAKRQMTQMDIANRLDVKSTGTISKKLAKPNQMSLEWLAAFAYALDVEVKRLYEHPDRPTQEELLAGLDEPKRLMIVEMIKAAKRA
jgi:transcriptional regulator with XRE-family HTH domain